MASGYEIFIALLDAAINKDIYGWGAQGQYLRNCTESCIRNHETSETNANNAIKLWRTRKGPYPEAAAADCSGGICYCMERAGLVKKGFDMNAHGLLHSCKKITKADLRVGDWVGQMNSKGNIFHIGVVRRIEGNQIWIVEWRGRNYGCVLTEFKNGANPWNYFGRPDKYYTAIKPQPEPPYVPTKPEAGWGLNDEVRLASPYMKGDYIVNLQKALSVAGQKYYKLMGSTGFDGVYGNGSAEAVKQFQKDKKLTPDGVVGQKTCEALGGKWKGSKPTPVPTIPEQYDYHVTGANGATLRKGNDKSTLSLGLYKKGTRVVLQSYFEGEKYARVSIVENNKASTDPKKNGYMYWTYIGPRK